jgi:GTPase SAR1 family protein
MDRFHTTKEAVLALNNENLQLIRRAETIRQTGNGAFAQWKQFCDHIHQSLSDHVMRIAVVGAIKSGKSTLVNALLGNDHLKRGAGVITSIVTRVRRGEQLKARLFFKSWDEINDDIEQAMVLFPSDDWQSDARQFDIRRSKDREDLAKALAALDSELKIARDGLNANSVLLSSYLKGFETVQAYVQADSNVRQFAGDEFSSHRKFVGDDALAVYLKDIQLEITGDAIGTNIEVADCQGSDSPNPLHMAMIQDYLLKAHLIVYVISSRTGLRQADIQFLSIIKQMGIAENMLFVCNCDFNEHETVDDLEQLVAKIKEELALVLSDAKIFVLSALYHLFTSMEADLSHRDKARLELWRQLSDLTAASTGQMEALQRELETKLTRERSALMLQNQLERVAVVQTGLLNWVRLNRNILSRDAESAKSMAERIQSHQGYMAQVQTMIRGTLDGSIQKITSELKREIDRFFDSYGGTVLSAVVKFVRNYHVALDNYRETVVDAGFNQTLYLVYQEFKQAVDGFMAEKVNPEIIGFIGGLEERVRDYFHSVIDPYEAMVRDAVVQYEKTLTQYHLEQLPGQWALETVPDMEGIKQATGLKLPLAAATMRYSAHIKTDAVLRLGAYSLLRLLKKVLKKQTGEKGGEELQALKGGIRRMKRETERSLHEHFKDYRENLKFQYMLRLVKETSSRLYEGLTEHFQLYVSDLETVISSMGSERSDQKELEDALKQIEAEIQPMNERMETLRESIRQLRGVDVDGDVVPHAASAQK